MVVFDAVAAGPFFFTERSALALASVDADELLLPGVGSGVDAVTFAVFVTVVPLTIEPLNFTVTLNVAVAPAGNDAIVQVTVAPVVQVNVGPVICDSETNVVPAGRTSVSATFAASDGPAFATAIA